MSILPLVLFAFAGAGEVPHLESNPVYQNLRETGIAITPKEVMKVTAPLLSDGLAEDEQRKVIETLIGRRYRWDLFTRKSTVAPQIMHTKDLKIENSDTKAQVVDVYFIAYGDLDTIAKSGGLTQPSDEGDKQWKLLTEQQLAKHKIVVDQPDQEAYGYLSNDLIDRVRVSGVLRTFWSRSEESMIASAILDSRFDATPELATRWQPLTRGAKGYEAGKSSPYHGAGGYTKITKLASPEGALFVESHLIFSEPHGWFNGANLLGSKLPAVIQSEVRSTRREILDAGAKK